MVQGRTRTGRDSKLIRPRLSPHFDRAAQHLENMSATAGTPANLAFSEMCCRCDDLGKRNFRCRRVDKFDAADRLSLLHHRGQAPGCTNELPITALYFSAPRTHPSSIPLGATVVNSAQAKSCLRVVEAFTRQPQRLECFVLVMRLGMDVKTEIRSSRNRQSPGAFKDRRRAIEPSVEINSRTLDLLLAGEEPHERYECGGHFLRDLKLSWRTTPRPAAL